MTFQQVLENIRTQLSTWRMANLNEAQTSQVIILRLLQALGYDIWNPNNVFAQEAANGSIPDFIVSCDDTRRFIVEVKKLDTQLTDRMKTQAVSYANNQAIQWAVLTNGAEWLLFDSFMVERPAHERLVLRLSLDDHDTQLLTQYFERLLATVVWLQPKDYLAKTAQDILEHITLHQQLQPLARELSELMDEYTVQDIDAGLKLAEKLNVWDAARHTLIRKHRSLLKQLLGSTDSTEHAATSPTPPQQNPSLIDTLKRGISQTAPPSRKSSSSELEAFIGDEKLEAVNWRDIHTGIAETFLILGRSDELEAHDNIYDTVTERAQQGKNPYKVHDYRQLQNGRFLLLHSSARSHRRKSVQLLKLLGVADKTIKVVYKGETYFLP